MRTFVSRLVPVVVMAFAPMAAVTIATPANGGIRPPTFAVRRYYRPPSFSRARTPRG
jgi:hypothetical protein